MNDNNPNGHCACGEATFDVHGKPLLRAFCHCTICQAYNQAPYADITLFRSSDVTMPQKENADFRAHKFPPVLQRSTCISCGKAVLEYLQVPPLPKIIIVPSRNIDDKALIPELSLHIFYDTRVADIQDELPKYSGYLKSQLAFNRKIMAALLRRGPMS